MNDKSGRLVADEDVLILVDDIEVHAFLGREVERLVEAGLLEEPDDVALGHLFAHLEAGLAVQQHGSFLNKLLQPRARRFRDERSEDFVQAFSPKALDGESW